MDDTSGSNQPLSESERDAVMDALLADMEEDFGPPLHLLPARALTWGEWQELTGRLAFREGFRDEGEAPLPCLEEPGTPGKVRELRRRFRERLSLFSDRGRQLHNAVSPGRQMAKLADALAAARHVEASARGKALAARARRNGSAGP